MKYVLVALVLVLLLQRASSEDEDLTEEEATKEAPSASTKEDSEEPPFQPPPKPSGDVYFAESFSDEEKLWKTWVKSTATKDGADSEVAKYDGEWSIESLNTDGAIDEDEGLVLSEAAKHYAVAAKLDRPFNFEDAEAFVIQYEVNFQNGLSCGGAYIKLLTSGDNLSEFNDKSPYSIMFGPDKCGVSSKIHFIIRFKNPVTGEVEEKHSKQSTDSMEFFNDKKTHLFTLLIRSDGVYHIIVDQRPFLKGNLLEDMTPPIVPPKEIDDPEDRMPEDWDEREKIPDPEAVKPDDWDEDAPAKIQDPDAVKPDGWLDDGPEYIADPDASMPEDWDEEEDGEYEPPMIPNPACEEIGCGEWKPPMIQNPNYKGKWKPPLIDNPEYDGKWSPRKISNPAYFENDSPFFSISPIEALGFELWSMSEGIFIDNVIVCGELTIANNYARDGWVIKMQQERAFGGGMSLGSWLDGFVDLANTYPYLWALYAVAIVLPFVCCIGCCCVRSKTDETARKKKTDEPSPDDPHTEEKEKTEQEPETHESEGGEKSFVAEAEGGEGEGEEGEGAEDMVRQSDEEEEEEEEAETEEAKQSGGSQDEGEEKEGEGEGEREGEGEGEREGGEARPEEAGGDDNDTVRVEEEVDKGEEGTSEGAQAGTKAAKKRSKKKKARRED